MPRLRNNQAPAGDKARFSISIAADTVVRLEAMADKKGLSRNALIAQLLAKAITPKAKKETK
jgi:metal-responsive CopG/Arc/MetJ family transcriptional regulator